MLEHYSGATRVYFIVGDPIAQVKSPYGMTAAFEARGQDAIMVPLHLKAADMPTLFELAQRMPNVRGLCITVPHKFAAASLCHSLSRQARSIGAANVVRRNADGSWHGHMCDGDGYVQALRTGGCEPKGLNALLVGAGGAGSAIAHALVDAGVQRLAVHDVDATRQQALIDKLQRYGQLPIAAGGTDPSGYGLVINATPMGMRPSDPLPLQAGKLQPPAFAGCVITQPEVPPWLAMAQVRGLATINGASMFAAVRERMLAFYAGAN